LRFAARHGQQQFINTLQAAVEHERAAFAEAIKRQCAEYDAVLEQQRAEFEQQHTEFERQLLVKVENNLKAMEAEHAALRRELAAAYAELDGLR